MAVVVDQLQVAVFVLSELELVLYFVIFLRFAVFLGKCSRVVIALSYELKGNEFLCTFFFVLEIFDTVVWRVLKCNVSVFL